MLCKVRKKVGGKRTSKEVSDLIFQMVAENPSWSAPRIHGELIMLGFEVSERTVSRWMRRSPRSPEPAQRWLAFLRNHGEAIAAMDFFTVPTVTFKLIIRHDRRQIVHVNVTRHPTSTWIVQQLREAFPYQSTALRSMRITGVQTSIQSPWQNGVAERWVGSCRRDLLDYIIALNERHLKRILADYVRYYHDDRTHLGLRKQTPGGRVRSAVRCHVLSHARLGGLHHRYDRAA
jgi:putative transposase